MVAAMWKTEGIDDLTACDVEFESNCESVILMLNKKKEILRTYVSSIVICDWD
jgi:hypothetical protein